MRIDCVNEGKNWKNKLNCIVIESVIDQLKA